MRIIPLMLMQNLIKRMWVGCPKCGSDPWDEGHLACLIKTGVQGWLQSSDHSWDILRGTLCNSDCKNYQLPKTLAITSGDLARIVTATYLRAVQCMCSTQLLSTECPLTPCSHSSLVFACLRGNQEPCFETESWRMLDSAHKNANCHQL